MTTDEQRQRTQELARDLAWFLRTCADAVERGDLDAHDVRQALFDSADYSIVCPISEAAGTGRPGNDDHAATIDALEAMANEMYLREDRHS
jgi:hypothetical protein